VQRLLVRGHHRSGTTLLSKILRNKPDLYITYELGTYDYPFIPNETNEQKLSRILSHLDNNFVLRNQDIRTDMLNLRNSIEEHIKPFSSPIDYINVIEEELFQNKYRIIGDKYPNVLPEDRIQYLMNFQLDFKVIWIYRDGRDVVSSCYRHGGQGREPKIGDTRPIWSCIDPKEGSLKWARVMWYWDHIYNKYKDIIPMLQIKFEDMFKYPNMVAEDIGNFLNIDPGIILNNIKTYASSSESNSGYYDRIIPYWDKQFTPESMSMLEKLGYI